MKSFIQMTLVVCFISAAVVAGLNAKATGFEPKIMRQVVRLRAMDRDLLNEQDALLDTYRDALGLR